ncbi:MAG: hypothetical protein ACLTGJ_00635 [Faecalibacterium prausnitzii]
MQALAAAATMERKQPGDAENIIIQGYATVDAESGVGGAGIGGAAMQEMQKTSSSGGIPR